MTDEPAHILVVDDDRRLRELLRKYLADSGFRVTTAESAEDARAKLGSLAFDLIVLDVMMPGENGLALTAALRPKTNIPILMLTAMGEAEDRIKGLETGADDYLPKPFEPRELVLRIKTILRRAPPPPQRPTQITFGDHRFDLGRKELWRGDKMVRLSAGEARLLKLLAESGGAAKTREDLQRELGSEGGGRSIDVQVTRLRRKIEPDPRLPRYLLTVRGQGYALRPD
jgi:two-component system, OmpR family, phosphate regulon response regulator OmpR